jgi:hypothetical protein
MNANTNTDRAIRSLNRAKSVKKVAEWTAELAGEINEVEIAFINKMIAAHQNTIWQCDQMNAAGY